MGVFPLGWDHRPTATTRFLREAVLPLVYEPLPMTFVTRLTLESGDRDALDDVVGDICEAVRRKGAEFKGPHSDTPSQRFVPLYERLDGLGETADSWHYTVYRRRLEIRGADELVRAVVSGDFPDSVHVSADIERVQHVGSPA